MAAVVPNSDISRMFLVTKLIIEGSTLLCIRSSVRSLRLNARPCSASRSSIARKGK